MAPRHRLVRAWWKLANPLTVPLAGFMPWWVVLETKGRLTGKTRRTPLANGLLDERSILLLSVHGEKAGFARNIAADPHVRLKRRGRWRAGVASFEPADHETLQRMSRYVRAGYRTVGDDPKFVRIVFDD